MSISKSAAMPGPRFGLYYGALFFAAGVQLPFWPIWLDSKGLSANEIAFFLAATTWAKILATPFAGTLADRSRNLRALLAFCAFGSLCLIAIMAVSHNYWLLLALQILGFALFQPLIPLGESQAMRAARQSGMDYGRARLWGSLTFIMAVLVTGRAVEIQGPNVIVWVFCTGIAVTGFSVLLLPLRSGAASIERRSWLSLLRHNGFLWLLLAGALLQASHAVYYAFSAIHWRSVGMSETLVAGLWAEGVIAEIFLFFLGRRLLTHISPLSFLAIAGIAGVFRWTVMGLTDSLIPLALIQVLHALTFGAAHLGTMHLLSDLLPEDKAASAQSLYSAAVGATMGLAMLLSGTLYSAYSSAAYYAMTLVSLIAVLVIWRLWIKLGGRLGDA
ncbi:PPP family 3-phenylpropionic acid transporter [Limibacillus sp. MBR-115]|jgi:PPP family 3-phenylpropionic acid transporter